MEKTIESIANELAKASGFNTYEEWECDYIKAFGKPSKIMRIVLCKAVAKVALKNASENAMLRHDCEDFPISSDWIDKQTILDTDNIPK
ncbi:hypothetical protein [Sphingobacterium sp. UBA6645]|uniref:hypothetical protein n=1 Tax=Sphingobacterium sp. UBA6645 TaxID=1947511 RepID=UPI0025DACBC9|nr:hypothetical protein [Sphingobacterium sp. UBA6645]